MTEGEQIAALTAVVHAFRAEFIDRPELKVIQDDLQMLVDRDNGASEGGVMTLMGVPRSGKTQLIAHFMANYPRERHAIVRDGKKSDRVTVIVVPVTDTGIKGLSKSIYEALAQADPPAEARFDIQKAIYHYAQEMETRLMIFEESHDADSDRSGQTVAAVGRLFKQFANKAFFSVLIVGTERVKSLVMANKELKGRNFGFHVIRPIPWDDAASREFFKKLLRTWDSLLGEALSNSGLGVGDLPEKIHKSCEGVIGLAAILIERAGINAVRDKVRHGGTCITEAHLWHAHELMAFEAPNPFSRPQSAPLPLAAREKPAEEPEPDRRGRGRNAGRERLFRP